MGSTVLTPKFTFGELILIYDVGHLRDNVLNWNTLEDLLGEENHSMNVYLLEPDFDYQGITIIDPDDDKQLDEVIDSEGKQSFSKTWRPITVVPLDEPLPTCDFPYLVADFLVFNQKAKEAMYELVAPYGEFLLMKHESGEELFLFNILNYNDALDLQKSKVSRNEISDRIRDIHQYAFIPEKINNQIIFKMSFNPARIYVTDTFVQKVREHQLTGLKFKQIWSSDFDPNYSPPNPYDTRYNRSQRVKAGRYMMKQLKDQLVELISHKTGFNKESIEIGSDVEINFEYNHMEVYFQVNNEGYLFSYYEAGKEGSLMKKIRVWDGKNMEESR